MLFLGRVSPSPSQESLSSSKSDTDMGVCSHFIVTIIKLYHLFDALKLFSIIKKFCQCIWLKFISNIKMFHLLFFPSEKYLSFKTAKW